MSDESSNEQQSGKAAPLESLLPIDEHIEEVSEDGRRVQRKGIFLLPNLFTTAALFAGFYAIVAAINGDFAESGLAIWLGQLLDGMDGRIARLTNSQSKFGEQYDSMSDMVSFGVAPALVMFIWCLSGLGKLGWAVAFMYVACAGVRLARFNAQADTADQRFFTGLASPPAATLIAATIWTGHDMGYLGLELTSWAQALLALEMALVGLLMVVNVPYHSFKGIDFKGRVPFAALFGVILIFVVISIDPPRVLLAMAATYALSGPVIFAWHKLRSKPTA